MIYNTLFLLSIMTLLLPFDGKANDICYDRMTIRSLSRPYFPNDQTSDHFLYKYQLLRQASGDSPTVIFIPGGPGQTSIGDKLNLGDIIPPDFGVALTDPRGVGCNSPDGTESYPDSFYKTAFIADDILSVTNDLKIPLQKIILYGVSYGTVVASTVSDLAFKRGLTPYRALILEGTLGRVFYGSEYADSYIDMWNKYRLGLNQEKLHVLQSIKKYQFKYAPKNWGDFFTSYLLIGGYQKFGHSLDYPIQLLTDETRHKEFEDEYLKSMDFTNTFNRKIWKNIWCGELNNEGDRWDISFDAESVSLKVVSKNADFLCDAGELLRPYNSSKLTIREDIIYFQGEDDPATPLYQALYHFNNIKGSGRRTLYQFPSFGHAPMQIIRGFNNCSKKILKTIDIPNNVQKTIRECGLEVSIKIRNRD